MLFRRGSRFFHRRSSSPVAFAMSTPSFASPSEKRLDMRLRQGGFDQGEVGGRPRRLVGLAREEL